MKRLINEFITYFYKCYLEHHLLNRSLSATVTIILLLVFSINTLFYYLYFNISEIKDKIEAHFSMIENEEHNILERIIIPKIEFNAQANEIWYYGNLYDLSSYKITGDSICLLVWHDDHEESLVNNYSSRMDDKESSSLNNKQIDKIQKANLFEYKFFQEHTFIFQHAFVSAVFGIPAEKFKVVNFSKVLSPPPRVIIG